jgi:DNA-binding MarR family transcriptional regulator
MTTKATRPRPGTGTGTAKNFTFTNRIERLRAEILAEAGNHVRKDGWAIQRWAMAQSARPAQKNVLLALAVHADERGYCKIKSRTLAEACGCKRRNLWDHIRALEAAGLIARVERHREDNNATIANGYWLPFWRDPCAVKCTPPVQSVAQGPTPCSAQDPVHSTALRRTDQEGERAKTENGSTPEQATSPSLPSSNPNPNVNTEGVAKDNKEGNEDQGGASGSPAPADAVGPPTNGVAEPNGTLGQRTPMQSTAQGVSVPTDEEINEFMAQRRAEGRRTSPANARAILEMRRQSFTAKDKTLLRGSVA